MQQRSPGIDFRKAVPLLLESMSVGFGDLLANDSYMFAREHPQEVPFSHSVRFLHNPWTMAAASEWLRQYGEVDQHDAGSVAEVWETLLSLAERSDLVTLQSWQIAEYLLALNLCAQESP